MPPPSHRAAPGVARGVAVPLLLLWWMPCFPPLWQALLPGTPDLVVDPGVGISGASRLQFAFLALLALAGSGWRPRWSGWNSAGVWGCLFLFWSALSALAGGDPIESGLFVLGWVAAAAVAHSAPYAVPQRPGPSWRAAVIYAPLLIIGLASLEPALRATGDFRAAGPFQLPGALANWLLMLLPLALAGLFRAERREMPWALLSSAFGVAALVMTVSRAAWLTGLGALVLLLLLEANLTPRSLGKWAAYGGGGLLLLVAVRHLLGGMGLLGGVALLALLPIVALVASRRLNRQVVFRLLLMGTLAGLLVSNFQPQHTLGSLTERRMSTLTGADESAVGRIQFWRAALNLSLQHPLLGVGPDRFSEAYPGVQEHYYYFSDSAHGTLVELLSEVGWVGAVLLGVAVTLFLTSGKMAPWSLPHQRAPLIGLLTGGLYSQVEVSYHFTVMWTTAAFLLALAGRSEGASPPPERFSPWPLPLLILTLIMFTSARDYQLSARLARPEEGYRMARRVSDRWPSWGRPALSALSLGLRSARPPAELEPLAARATRQAPEDAAAYQMAGEVAMAQGRYEQARADYTLALQRDHFNRPGIYHGLLRVATATGDAELRDRVVRDALQIYDLEKGWGIAHPGHRQKLAGELRPLLYDIAQNIDPQREPARTEPLYRFLVETSEQPEAAALRGWGISLRGLGEPDKARQALEQAHLLDPNYPAP